MGRDSGVVIIHGIKIDKLNIKDFVKKIFPQKYHEFKKTWESDFIDNLNAVARKSQLIIINKYSLVVIEASYNNYEYYFQLGTEVNKVDTDRGASPSTYYDIPDANEIVIFKTFLEQYKVHESVFGLWVVPWAD